MACNSELWRAGGYSPDQGIGWGRKKSPKFYNDIQVGDVVVVATSSTRTTNAIMSALWFFGYTLRGYNFHFRDFYKIGIRCHVSKVVGTLMKGFSFLGILLGMIQILTQ